MSEPKLVQVIHQRPSPGRDVSIFHSTHKGREEIVLSQPTPNGRQLVEVAIDIDRLEQVVEALQSLLDYLKPTPAPLGSVVPPGTAGSLEL